MTKKKKPWTKAPVSRAITGGVTGIAFVAVTAAMGPIFPADADAAIEAPVTTTMGAPAPTWPTTETPTTAPPTTVPAAAPLPPTTIVITVRREVLVDNGSGAGAPPPPAPAPRSSPTPAPAPSPAAPAPVTTAAPAPPAPPPPPPPAATPPLTSGS